MRTLTMWLGIVGAVAMAGCGSDPQQREQVMPAGGGGGSGMGGTAVAAAPGGSVPRSGSPGSGGTPTPGGGGSMAGTGGALGGGGSNGSTGGSRGAPGNLDGGVVAAAGDANSGAGGRPGMGGMTGAGGSAGQGGSIGVGGKMGSAGVVDAGGAMAGGSMDDLQFCLDENNRYRAMVNAPALVRSATIDAFAAIGAKYDYEARTPHKHFKDSMGVPGARAAAENEIPGFSGWNLARLKTIHAVIQQGVQSMWNEGPGGGHYENMKNPAYKQFGCGVYVAPNQDVTVTMDFTN